MSLYGFPPVVCFFQFSTVGDSGLGANSLGGGLSIRVGLPNPRKIREKAGYACRVVVPSQQEVASTKRATHWKSRNWRSGSLRRPYSVVLLRRLWLKATERLRIKVLQNPWRWCMKVLVVCCQRVYR
jgi:hypothetical protein